MTTGWAKMADDLIDEKNFAEYFRDCRISRPQRGDVMAKYTATADFVDGRMKRDIIDLLKNKEKAFAATQVMRKLGGASQRDSIRVCREMAEDLDSGMSDEEVESKAYRYTFEMFFYTKREHVPADDPHWSIISIANLDTFLDKQNRKVTIESKIVLPDASEQEAELGASPNAV